MNIKEIILKEVNKGKEITVDDIVKKTGFSRAYINRFFQDIRNEGKIILIGKARKSFYIKAEKNSLIQARKKILNINRIFKRSKINEDVVLNQIKKETGIFIDLKDNLGNILNYAFTEMLNNAIDHSQSKDITIKIKKDSDIIRFDIIDRGIGIFNNIMQKHKLKNQLEAIQDLLKGKQTTMPEEHSGEGIFFTSKLADNFVIESSDKKLIFNNIVDDIFIQDIKETIGTKVIFTISTTSQKQAKNVFDEYAGDSYEFSKTKVNVKLYKMGSIYISRSQARRITTGLDKFKVVVLDFNHIKSVGQSFADEIFRVWQNNNPEIKIISQNSNENIDFMINRARGLQKNK